jgi:DNA-binding phage protein
MPTQSYAETLKASVAENPALADHLFEDAIRALFAGEVDEGRILLRTHINATIGFPALAELTGKNAKSIMRMLGPDGNPTASNLFDIIGTLGRAEGVTIEARLQRVADAATR